jgi:hypothetical protein
MTSPSIQILESATELLIFFLSSSNQNAGQYLNTSHDSIFTDPSWLVMDIKQEDGVVSSTDSTNHKCHGNLQKQITRKIKFPSGSGKLSFLGKLVFFISFINDKSRFLIPYGRVITTLCILWFKQKPF